MEFARGTWKAPDDRKGAEPRELGCGEGRPRSLTAFLCIFRNWMFLSLGEIWRSASGPLSKQGLELEMWRVGRAGTSFSNRQTAKAPTEAHSEKKKTKEAISK